MKKILLFLSMLPSILFAQIVPIQTQEKPYEFVVGNMLYRKVATDTYYLQIESDNQFEDKAAILELGNGPTEAMTSLGNLFSLFGKEDSDFSLQGYRFGVRKTYIFAYHVGPLEYSAGEHVLRQTTLALIMKELMKKKDMPLGDVRIVYFDKSAVFVHYDTYQVRDAVNFYNMSLPWSHEYTRGDIISDDDIRLILKAIQNPNAYRSKTAKSGAYVLEKEQLIKVCETILSK